MAKFKHITQKIKKYTLLSANFIKVILCTLSLNNTHKKAKKRGIKRKREGFAPLALSYRLF